jgi:NAD(P)-dependent dehydrogenase (short-subunit alcohol dehydrogenase family)
MSRLILITGVSRGLGRALVNYFDADGHRVFGCGRSSQALDSLAGESSERVSLQSVDVRDDQAVAAWVESVIQQAGAPELLINNAAVINPNAPLWEIDAPTFDQVIDINIKGVQNVLRHALPAMVQQRRGVIVNLSSGWGRSTSPEVAPYCATKWAIEGLTQALAQELPEGMAAVPLNPGVIHTAMLESCFGLQPIAMKRPRIGPSEPPPSCLGSTASTTGSRSQCRDGGLCFDQEGRATLGMALPA